MTPRETPLADRLWQRVDRTAGPNSCWPWNGAKHRFGYGSMWNTRIKRVDGTHRIAWEITHGPVPSGLAVLHTCDNAVCCNPSHLYLGTQADNMHDLAIRGRAAKHLARLSDAQVREIRSLATAGQKTTAIARRYGVHRMTITRILKGDTWTHVT